MCKTEQNCLGTENCSRLQRIDHIRTTTTTNQQVPRATNMLDALIDDTQHFPCDAQEAIMAAITACVHYLGKVRS